MLPTIIRRGTIWSLILFSLLLAIKQARMMNKNFPASASTTYWIICIAIALAATLKASINLWWTLFFYFHSPMAIPCHALTKSCPAIGTVIPRSAWSIVYSPRSFTNQAPHPITARKLDIIASALCSCSFSRWNRAPRRVKKLAEVKNRAVKRRGGRREWG